MENGRSKRTDKFFAGKGFYIVLALCIAVIGISAVSIALNSDGGKAPELLKKIQNEVWNEFMTETAAD